MRVGELKKVELFLNNYLVSGERYLRLHQISCLHCESECKKKHVFRLINYMSLGMKELIVQINLNLWHLNL